MPFRNLRQLMSADEMLPRSEEEVFPQYERMLRNARDRANIKDYNQYLEGTKTSPMSRESNFPNYLKFLEHPVSAIDRNDINDQLMEAYLRDIHPDIIQNRKVTSTPEEYRDLLLQQPGVARELSGLSQSDQPEIIHDPDIMSEERINAGTAERGNFNPRQDSIKIADVTNFAPLAHEFLHKADVLNAYHGNRELPIDLRNSPNLTQAIQNVNNQHIQQYLNEQHGQGDPVGESGMYYNKFNQMLDQAQKDKFNDMIQSAMPDQLQNNDDNGMKLSSNYSEGGSVKKIDKRMAPTKDESYHDNHGVIQDSRKYGNMFADGGDVEDDDDDTNPAAIPMNRDNNNTQDNTNPMGIPIRSQYQLTNPQDQQAVADSMDADKQRQAKIAAMQKMIMSPMSSENQQMANNMMEGMSMGVTAPVEAGAARVAEGISPELAAKIRSIMQNPGQAIGTVGPMDMGKFQKLRDLMGHVGPVVVK